jgi:hypothetical protein
LSKYKDKNNGLNKESDVLAEDLKMNKHIFCLQRKTGLAEATLEDQYKANGRHRRSGQDSAGVHDQEYTPQTGKKFTVGVSFLLNDAFVLERT